MSIMTAFLPHLDTAAIGAPITRVGVSLFPVYLPGRPATAPTVVTGPGAPVEISERPDAMVPTLVATNRSDSPVLLVEGQIVEGGRQNRVLNVSVVVPARGTIDIPDLKALHRWAGFDPIYLGATTGAGPQARGSAA